MFVVPIVPMGWINLLCAILRLTAFSWLLPILINSYGMNNNLTELLFCNKFNVYLDETRTVFPCQKTIKWHSRVLISMALVLCVVVSQYV